MNLHAKRNPSVVIIGAGMTGILMTIKLREAGITDITILEKKENLGGTWRENTYPGVACDVPAHMYTYSFELNPEWSNRFADGSEIQEYFERVGRKYNVTERIRFNEAVTGARYDSGKWHIETSKNEKLAADFLISATGILHHPVKPDINGIGDYQGDIFHTAEWDHSVELKGKRVAIIGTGSTASQVISELSGRGVDITVMQRTAQWILPMPNKKFSEKLKEKCRKSSLRMELANLVYTQGFEFLSKAVTGNKLSHFIMSTACKFNLRFSVKDRKLRKKLTPDYKVGCKRIVTSEIFYKAMQRPNVNLITEGIECINKNGIKTVDGKQHDFDVIVLATGFDPTAFMRPMNLVGKSGSEINSTWQHKVQAYRSLCLPDYPNFFLMLGPNTPIGNFSVIKMSEVQTPYVIKLIERWRNHEFDEVAATPKALTDFAKYIKKGMKNTVWTSGCKSWYLDADGDALTWPYSWKQWNVEMAEPDMNDFVTEQYDNKTVGCEEQSVRAIA